MIASLLKAVYGQKSMEEADLFLKQAFDTTSGIHNHIEGHQHPFESVKMREGSDYWVHGPIRDLIEEFVLENLGDLFKCSLIEYLSLPMPYVNMLRKIKDQALNKQASALDEIQKNINRGRNK